jgi:malate dehydrogenase (oxaloacetate-decarboxylating)
MNIESIRKVHSEKTGKLEINSTVKLDSMEILSEVYTPGVAEISKEIFEDQELSKKYTIAGKTIAVISDGSAVLGLGNIGPRAALPVMEGKCAIFKEFAGVNAFPLCLDTQDIEEIISIVKAVAPNFAAINLEDISSPRCFEIEQRLIKELSIPIMHDDQHGTAIVSLAALKGALTLVPKRNVRIVLSGAGAAGTAITKLLSNTKTILDLDISDIKVYDSQGLINSSREDLTPHKKELADITNQQIDMEFSEALSLADVFIGVSKPGVIDENQIKSMNTDPIIFALANPEPEIMPDIAKLAGAKVVATGRSDFPNQVNNALAYPGVFKGLLEGGLEEADERVKLQAVDAIYNYHLKNLSLENILPSILDKDIVEIISNSISNR